jgi:HSP20 family protein
MSTLTRRDNRSPLSDMVEWLEAPWAAFRPVAANPMRIEAFIQDGSYVIRAELPGIDPEKDVEVTVADGILTIKAERREEKTGKHHSEFRYGTFTRSVTLPVTADTEHIVAVYGHGILEVTVKLSEPGAEQAVKTIPVQQNQHIKPT